MSTLVELFSAFTKKVKQFLGILFAALLSPHHPLVCLLFLLLIFSHESHPVE